MSNDIQLIEIPKWGISMIEGTVSQWLINEGDSFDIGDEVVEIESSKIVNVVEAHFSGTLRRIVANAGETLAVGMPIGVAANATVSDEEIDAFVLSLSSSQTDSAAIKNSLKPVALESQSARAKQTVNNTESPATAIGNAEVPEILKQGDAGTSVHATVHARRLAQDLGINLNNVTASGRNDRISRQDIERAIIANGGSIASARAVKAKSSPGTTKDDSQVAATPVARRLAKQLGVNLHDCRVSGSHSRVAKADVEAVHQLTSETTQPVTGSSVTEEAASDSNESTVIPMDGMRRTIATRLQESKQTAPHFRLTVDVDIDRLLAIRKKLNTYHLEAKISVNDFLIKASASALVKVPDCNVQFDGTSIVKFKDADISVAVALESGLITPIVKGANNKGLVEISNDVRTLVTKAKTGTLTSDEFRGGTFSISNLGMLGIKHFDAIINPPQGAILAVGSGDQRIVVKNGESAIATMMTLTLSSDHRIIDGALGAQFMRALKWFLENPAMMVA